MYVHSKFFLLFVHSQRGHNMRSWQGKKVRVLGVQGLHRVSRSKLQVSPLTLTPVRIQKIRKQDPYQNYQKEFGDKCLKSYKKKVRKPYVSIQRQGKNLTLLNSSGSGY